MVMKWYVSSTFFIKFLQNITNAKGGLITVLPYLCVAGVFFKHINMWMFIKILNSKILKLNIALKACSN